MKIARAALALAALGPALLLTDPEPEPVVWGRVLPRRITVDARQRVRTLLREDGEETPSEDRTSEVRGALSRLGAGERYRGTCSEHHLDRLAEAGKGGAEREVLVAHNQGRWIEVKRRQAALLPALNRGAALRGLIPEDRGPKPGEEWSLPYPRLRERFGLDHAGFELETEDEGELRFIGLRAVGGVVCQAYSLAFDGEGLVAGRSRVTLRLSGLLLIEQRSGLPRLFNLGLRRVRYRLREDGAEVQRRVLIRLRERLSLAAKKH